MVTFPSSPSPGGFSEMSASELDGRISDLEKMMEEQKNMIRDQQDIIQQQDAIINRRKNKLPLLPLSTYMA